MRRREFLKVAGAGAALSTRMFAAEAGPRALPSPEQVAWQEMELGMFIHFAPNTWQDVESDDLSTPLAKINPVKLNTDQWAQTAKDLGAKYIVFVAKHQGGFCMWQTQTTDYSIRNTPWRSGKGDVLRDIQKSCEKFGLKLGVYLCPRDDHFGAKTGGICATPEKQAQYDAMYREQLTEVVSRYGEMVEVWFDGSSATPIADILKKYQPKAMVFQGPSATIRWVGNEDGFAPYPCWNGIDRAEAKTGTATALNSDPDGDAWMPSEVDVSIRRPKWFWTTRETDKVLTVDQLMSIYYRSVGHGAQLLLNLPPNRDGLMDSRDVASAKGLGEEIRRRFAKPVAMKSAHAATVTVEIKPAARVDTVVMAEDIRMGERIRAYTLEGRLGDKWVALGSGTAVGHKRFQPVEAATMDAVRLSVTKSVGVPAVKMLAVYDTGVAAPADWNAAPQVWAKNTVGRWKDHAFNVDLAKKIKDAAQYRLKFVGRGGEVNALQDVVLKLHGVAAPQLLKPVKGKRDELILDMTEVSDSVMLSGRVDDAASGDILLNKI